MGKPVVLLADDARTRGRVEAELGKRYGADYQVIVTGSAQEALEALGELRDGQCQVSLVLAGQWLQDVTGTALLARVREFYPAARRVLLISWGDQAVVQAVVQATVLGDLDAYVVRPGTPPDEVFHRSVTEQLGEWGRSNLPGIEVVRVVGEEWAARSHELRELLGRNGIPFSFYPADSPEGQRLRRVDQAGQRPLRRDRDRGRAGRPCGGGLWRIRGAIHRGRRAGSHRRPGRYQLADP